MKQVWLVHRSSKERLGPFDMEDGFVILKRIKYEPNECAACGIASTLIPILGFTVEDALPEKITITRNMFMLSIFKTTDSSIQSICLCY